MGNNVTWFFQPLSHPPSWRGWELKSWFLASRVQQCPGCVLPAVGIWKADTNQRPLSCFHSRCSQLLFRRSSEAAVFGVSESWPLLCWCLESSVVVALVAPGVGQEQFLTSGCCNRAVSLDLTVPDFYCPSLSNGSVSTYFLTCNCLLLEISALFSWLAHLRYLLVPSATGSLG